MRVKPLFAPRHGPEMEVMKQMLKAKKSIDFAMFTFASSSGIDLAMLRLVRAVPKLRIRGVLDREQGLREWAPTKALAAATRAGPARGRARRGCAAWAPPG